METSICLYKPIGITPLQLINHFRKQYPEYANVTLSYAGRLDPMAEGLLLILVGDENKKREIHEDAAKVYECEVLFGAATDTYDMLGKIVGTKKVDQQTYKQLTTVVQRITPSFIGKQTQPYPPYSSQPVNGKPLYYWARNNKLEDITIPTKNIEIYTIEFVSNKQLTSSELERIIVERIKKVDGDFRQKEILSNWQTFLEEHKDDIFPIFRFRISCSSGTYIRSFANNLGKKLDIPTLAFSIIRTDIGRYNLQDCLKLDIL